MKPKKTVVTRPASSSSAESHSTFNLCKLIKVLNRKKLFALKWLQKIGMLNRESACDNCGRPMTLVHRQNCTGSRADKYEWECNKCRMCTKSLRSGTVFQSSKLSLQKITILMYFWAHDFPPRVAQRELAITDRTVSKWYLLCQEACMDALIRNTSKLGGEGRNLEVIEGKLGKRAIDHYRTPAEHPAIGVIDVDSGSCFLQVVIGNTKATLLTLLKERVANGSTLHSRCWRFRDCYSDEKFCKVVKNHKLTLCNEDLNTFKKLRDKVCKSQEVGTEFTFDPVLCATIYKNAMKNEEFFFVKFLGELGTLYRDGIRYEMMSQLERTDLEPGPSNQHRGTVNTGEKREWTSTVCPRCAKCRAKEYNDSEVQATPSDEITICEDTNETQNVSVSKQKVCKSGQPSEDNVTTSDDIIMLEDTCKSRNSITSEQTAHSSGYIHRVWFNVCKEVTEVEQPDELTSDGKLGRIAGTSAHISEAGCTEANGVFVLKKHDKVRKINSPMNSSEAKAQKEGDMVLLDEDSNLRNEQRPEVARRVSGCRIAIHIGGREPKEVHTNLDTQDDKQSKVVANVGHIDEIDISMEEQNDVHEEVGETQAAEASAGRDVKARGQKDGRGDVDVDSAHSLQDKDLDITVCEEKDSDVTAENPSCVDSKIVNIESVEDNAAEKKIVPIKMIVPAKRHTGVASDEDVDNVEDAANDCGVKGSKGNPTADRKREADSDQANIDDAEGNVDESKLKESKTNTCQSRKRDEASCLVNIHEAEDNANVCSVKGNKSNASPGRKRNTSSDLISIDDTEDDANEHTVKESKSNASPGRKKDASSDLVNIDGTEDNAAELTVKQSKSNTTPCTKKDVHSDVVNIDDAEDNADELTIKFSKSNASPGRKKDASSDLVNIDDIEDNADECTVKGNKSNGISGRKRVASSDLVNIDDTEDDTNERTVKCSKSNASPGRKDTSSGLVNIDDIEDNAAELTVKHSKSNASPGRKKDTSSDLVNIDDIEDNADECTVEGNKSNASAARKSDVSSDLVNVDESEDNANEKTVKGNKSNESPGKKRDVSSDLVSIDDAEDKANNGTVKGNAVNASPGRKRDESPDQVDIVDAEYNANECTEKQSKTNANADRKRETDSAVVDIDVVDDNENEHNNVISKRSPAKRKSSAVSDVVSIVDVEDNSTEGKDVLRKTNTTPGRKRDADSDVVNIDDADDSADERKRRRRSASQTVQKESATSSTDVIDIDEVDSDVEVIDTVPDVMVVGEEKRKKFTENFSPGTSKGKWSRPSAVMSHNKFQTFYCKEESRLHERRILIDDVPCSLSKSVLRTYFSKFGNVDYIKILPLPSRRSLRYAVLEFKTKQIVDTIQAARPHMIESGIKFVTFRGCSPDIDTSLNTRLKARVIVKVRRDNLKLTTDDVQQYFAGFGIINHTEQVTITGAESGSSMFVVTFEDYDSADVACLKSPHTIKGVENVTCEKVEDDDLLLSGTEMDPICIENDSDIEEVAIAELKKEPRQSEELTGLDAPSTSGTQARGGKRLSDDTTDVSAKKFCSYRTYETNIRTPQNTTLPNVTPSVSPFPGARAATVTNGRLGLPAMPGGSNYGGQGSGRISWHLQGVSGRPLGKQLVERPVRSDTPAPTGPENVGSDGDGNEPGERSARAMRTVGELLAAAIRQGEDVRKRRTEVRPYRLQPTVQRPPFQPRLPQWQQGRRPRPQHFQPRQGQPWPPARRQAQPVAPPASTAVHQRVVISGVPIASGGPANSRSFIPRGSGQQGPRF